MNAAPKAMRNNDSDVMDVKQRKAFAGLQVVAGAQEFGDDSVRRLFPLIAAGALSASATVVGLLAFVPMLTQMVAAVIAGERADRLPPRQMMLLANGVRALIAVVLAGLGVSGVLSAALMVWVALALAVCDAAYTAAQRVMLNALFSAEQMVAASSRLLGLETVGGLLAPAVGGALLAVGGPSAALVGIAVAYALATAALLAVPPVHPQGREMGSPTVPYLRRAGAGFTVAFADRYLRPWVISTVVLNMGSMVGTVVGTVYVVQELGFSPAVLAAVGVGPVAGALLASSLAAKITRVFGPGPTRICAGLLAAASAAAVPGLGERLSSSGVGIVWLALAWTGWSFAVAVAQLALSGLLQSRASMNVLGRVGAAFGACIMGAMALAAVASGWIADGVLSARATLWAQCGLAVMATLILGFSSLRSWRPGSPRPGSSRA